MIKISERYRIKKPDPFNIVLEEYKEFESPFHKTKRMGWDRVGYFGSVKAVLSHIVDKELMELADTETELKDIIAKIDELKEQIQNLDLRKMLVIGEQKRKRE